VNQEQAKKILMPFKQDLQQALREGLSKGPGELRGIFWLEFPATEEVLPGEA
jgi:hypothetical protein